MAQPANVHTLVAHDNGHSAETRTKMRHILVIGATRHTGKHAVQQALAAGHTVTALARDPARIAVQHERLSVVRGDVMDPATLTAAIAGCDAVVSSLGATSAYRAPTTLYSQGMQNIIQAMRVAGVSRLIAVTAAPLADGEGDALFSRVMARVLWTILKELYSDMARMEQVIRASGLDWTIIRPPKLTDKPLTGHYRTAINRNVRGGNSIGRADLAHAILNLLDDPDSFHRAIGIGY